YNGVIIAPGENFSFNDLVGEISEDTGFVEGAIIFGGRTVKGIGGGVCQVSTTAYRAAFSGGYEIMERHSHGYRVGYYEQGGSGPGLDAAIYITDPGDRNPGADFKFANNTDYHLLIETEFMGDLDALEFRFYSTNPGHTVEISEPIVRNVTQPLQTVYEVNENLQPGQQLQVDWSQEGGDVIVTRIIRDDVGNILERRDYGTFYQPWAAVVQVAPGDSRAS
ncbi:MAG: VanW family protein, partial [Chloroflexota bacterium]